MTGEQPGGVTGETISESTGESAMRDVSFWGITITQFLGAFNDNLFKQMIMLLCVDVKVSGLGDFQPYALALFAIPFVMFSGFAGYLSDRYSKRRIIVISKLAEIVVMMLGVGALLAGAGDIQLQVKLLLAVLFFMGMQSAFFGPSKYGVLPELFHEHDLPAVNGMIQMTTFLAIIFGMALAGFAIDWSGGELWNVTMVCVLIAVAGTVTSLLIRRTPVAQPGLPFRRSALAVEGETWRLLRSDGALMKVLLVSSLFWFIGGVVQPVINEFGRVQMGLSHGRASMLAACIGIGIAVGCVTSGRLSRQQIKPLFVTAGAIGIVISLVAVVGIAPYGPVHEIPVELPPEPLFDLLVPLSVRETLARVAFTSLGFAAGFFVVPLQVFLQAKPPEGQKGRMIGAMNLFNWIGIVLSAGFHLIVVALLNRFDQPISFFFPVLALVMLPVAIFYRAPAKSLE